MCVQDLRLANFTTPKIERLTADGTGEVTLPDVSKALLIWGFTTDQQVQLHSKANGLNVGPLPEDARYTISGDPFDTPVYSRESLGGYIRGPLRAFGAPGETVSILWLELDDSAFGALQSPVFPTDGR